MAQEKLVSKDTSSQMMVGSVKLGKFVKIFPNNPMSEMDRPPIKAYEALHEKVDKTKCFALICDPDYMPRIDDIESYMHMQCDSFFALMEYGVVEWPLTQREVFVLIYKARTGVKRLAPDEKSIALGLSPSLFLKKIIPTFIQALSALEQHKLAHGSIKISNIYALYDGSSVSDIIIGDMLALPYGFDQAIANKTAPAMLADPQYCGDGTLEDDIYAVGVCCAMMLRKQNPQIGKIMEKIWESKILFGTYTTLLDQERFGSAHLEFLRGVLQDDLEKRWSVEEIILWRDGRKLSPKQHVRPKAAPRPLVFNDQKYSYIDFIARDLRINSAQASELASSGQLVHWVERSLNDKNKAEKLRDMLKTVKGNVKGHMRSEVVSAIMSFTLNEDLPIFFKKIAAYPSALSALIWLSAQQKLESAILVEFIKSGLIGSWVALQTQDINEKTNAIKESELCLDFLRSGRIGYGLERCVYALIKRAPCLSSALEKYYVQDSKDLIEKMELIASKGSASGRWQMLMDRHICAFLAEREPKAIEQHAFDLDSSEESVKLLATLAIYADLQKRHKLKKDQVQHIVKLFQKDITKACRRYHDHDLRKDVQSKAEKACKKGDLSEIYAVLSNRITLNNDKQAFKDALQEYKALEEERQDIQQKLIDQKKFNQNFGREISAMISSALAGLIITLLVISFFAQG